MRGFIRGQRRHLRAALDLEDPDRVRGADHVVDGGVLRRDRGELEIQSVMITQHLQRVPDRREHPQPQQVELHQPDPRAVVLVPLQDRPVGHAGPLDRAHLADRSVADHHAAGVDAEVAREVQQLAGHPVHVLGDVVIHTGLDDRRPPVDLLRPRVLLPLGVAERLGHVADRRARAVGDHVGDLRRPVAAVALVDVLDRLLATVALDVDVDVGRAVALGREEPLEQQVEGHRVGAGDPQREADRGVGGRAPCPGRGSRGIGRTRRCRAPRGSSRGSRAAR